MACSCQTSRRDCLNSNIGSCLPLQTTCFPELPSTVAYHPYRASGLVHGRQRAIQISFAKYIPKRRVSRESDNGNNLHPVPRFIVSGAPYTCEKGTFFESALFLYALLVYRLHSQSVSLSARWSSLRSLYPLRLNRSSQLKQSAPATPPAVPPAAESTRGGRCPVRR